MWEDRELRGAAQAVTEGTEAGQCVNKPASKGDCGAGGFLLVGFWGNVQGEAVASAD